MPNSLTLLSVSACVLGIALIASPREAASQSDPGGPGHEKKWECSNGLDDDGDGDIDGFDSDCGGSGGGDPTISTNDVTAGWRGDVREVTIVATQDPADPPPDTPWDVSYDNLDGTRTYILQDDPLRYCSFNQVQQGGNHISYGCDHSDATQAAQAIEIDIGRWSWIQTRKNVNDANDAICDFFKDEFENPRTILFRPLTQYSIRKEGTSVRIQNTAFESDAAVSFTPPIGLIWFPGFTEATPARDGDANPFSEAQHMVIERFEVKFVGLGTNKTLAECEYTPPADREASFDSFPAP